MTERKKDGAAMTMNDIGGFLFIPPGAGVSASDISHRILDTFLAGATFHRVSVERQGQHGTMALPVEAVLAEVIRLGQGHVSFDLPLPQQGGFKALGAVDFAPHASGYYLVGMRFHPAGFRASRADVGHRATVELLYERWVRCCEQTEAEYASFGWLSNDTDRAFAGQIVQNLVSGRLSALVSEYGLNWLTYLGPRLAALAREVQLEEGETRQELASGGVVLRTSEFPLPW